MRKGREWAKEKSNNRTRKRQKAGQRLRETQFLVRHSQKMCVGIGTSRGQLPLILALRKIRHCKIWRFHPSFSPSAVSVFTRLLRRSAAAPSVLTNAALEAAVMIQCVSNSSSGRPHSIAAYNSRRCWVSFRRGYAGRTGPFRRAKIRLPPAAVRSPSRFWLRLVVR